MTPYITVTSKLPKLTKAQRRLLLGLAREKDLAGEGSHWKYPHRKERLPVKALVAFGYATTERRNGSYIVRLTEAGYERAVKVHQGKLADFERWNLRSIAVGCGPWPEVLRPQALAPWTGGSRG
jgi:hypothetical protein